MGSCLANGGTSSQRPLQRLILLSVIDHPATTIGGAGCGWLKLAQIVGTKIVGLAGSTLDAQAHWWAGWCWLGLKLVWAGRELAGADWGESLHENLREI